MRPDPRHSDRTARRGPGAAQLLAPLLARMSARAIAPLIAPAPSPPARERAP